jgi:hypothetical protein
MRFAAASAVPIPDINPRNLEYLFIRIKRRLPPDVVELETSVPPLGMPFEWRKEAPKRPLFDPSCVVVVMTATSFLPLTMLMTPVWYVEVDCRHRVGFCR